MQEIISTVFIIGAAVTDTLEAWVLGLLGLVIVIDLIVGIRCKSLLALGFVQAVGLTGGYLWASQISQQQDVSGPYAWAIVVGLWCIFSAIFHIALVAIKLKALRQRP